jgi:hypothetical protein
VLSVAKKRVRSSREKRHFAVNNLRENIVKAEINVNLPRAKIRLERITCDYGQPYAPDENGEEWWEILKRALGTASSGFVETSLNQLVMAAKLPGGVSRKRQ